MNSLHSKFKSLLYKSMSKILSNNQLSLLLSKLFELSLLSNNFHFNMKLLNLLKHSRLHLTSYPNNLDYDLTYINHTAIYDHKFSNILDIYLSILNNYRKIFQSYYGHETSSFSDLLDLVPELRDSTNHYCFLTSSAMALQAKIIVDIGTASGSSMVAFLLAPSVKYVHTFDINPLETNNSWVSKQSFNHISNFLEQRKDNWTQYVANLTIESNFNQYLEIFREADIILIDIDHSGLNELTLFNFLKSVVKNNCLFIWDDIRISSLQHFWSQMQVPKLDVGSVGHHSGTGISLLSPSNNG